MTKLSGMLGMLDALHAGDEHDRALFAQEVQRLWPAISAVLHAATEAQGDYHV